MTLRIYLRMIFNKLGIVKVRENSNSYINAGVTTQSPDPSTTKVINLCFDTVGFKPFEQFTRWREMVSNIGIIDREVDFETPFFAKTTTYYTSSAVLARYGANCQSSLDRSAQIAANSGDDAFSIQLRLSGFEYESNISSGELQKPDSLRIIDLARPVYSANESHDVISFVLQKKELFDRLPEIKNMHGVFIPNTPMTQLFKKQLIHVMDALPNLAQTEADQTAEILSDMFWACVQSQTQPEFLESETMDRVVLQAVRDCIDHHLHNPDLSPLMIAQIVAVSRSKLFTVCQPYGGPMELVRFKRLRRAMNLLKTGQCKNISDTAYAVGFDNRETFSRAFKKEFGCSPKEFLYMFKGHDASSLNISPNSIPEWQRRNSMYGDKQNH